MNRVVGVCLLFVCAARAAFDSTDCVSRGMSLATFNTLTSTQMATRNALLDGGDGRYYRRFAFGPVMLDSNGRFTG